MYIHIGQDTVLRESSVIGIFDLDNTTSSRITRDFLARAESRGGTHYTSEDIPKAFVLVSENGRDDIYLTQLGPAALSRRASEERVV